MSSPTVPHIPPRSVPDISIAFLIISVIHTLGQDFKTFPQVKTNRTRILLIDFQMLL